MNGIVKVALRASSLRGVGVKYAQKLIRGDAIASGQYQLTRNFKHMCFTKPGSPGMLGVKLQKPSICNSDSNNQRFQHTKSEQELVQFLAEEITAECKAVKMKTLPTKIDDFEVKLDCAEVTLTRTTPKERITVNFNVNHTVDTDEEEPEANPDMDKPDIGELKSKPSFDIDIEMKDQTLSFSCSFLPPADTQQSEYNDIFGIDEITIYKGEWSDKTYAVAGEVIDGCFYDLLMNLLEEKGVSNDFVQKLSDFSSAYEHSLYIALLENTKKFVSGK